MYKSKLQQLCQQHKWALPSYTCIKDGDDHRPQFKASVVVDGVSFDTPTAANSSKQALNDAAGLAFLHFTSDQKSVKLYREELTYKSKLQDLCQKQKWALPKYTCIRDGADHCPQFKASVVVRGIAFDTPTPCGSSKRALNEVARVAFLHFTSQPSNQRSEEVEKTNHGKEDESSKSSKHDLQEGFKNKLMMYAQRKGLKKPSFSTERKGQCFKARVSIGEDWFTTCDELCATAQEAENSAAATALLALLTDAFHENDPCSYKTLLKKLASNEGFYPPTYKTMRCDGSVSSTVEVEGEVFAGAAAVTEKLAELNAAKAAYTALIERKLFQPCDEVLKLARRFESAGISDPQETATKHGGQESVWGENQDEEGGGESDCLKKSAEMKSCHLVCNRVRVFTCMPNMALPEGMVVLPVSENRWAVVALEFPAEKAV